MLLIHEAQWRPSKAKTGSRVPLKSSLHFPRRTAPPAALGTRKMAMGLQRYQWKSLAGVPGPTPATATGRSGIPSDIHLKILWINCWSVYWSAKVQEAAISSRIWERNFSPSISYPANEPECRHKWNKDLCVQRIKLLTATPLLSQFILIFNLFGLGSWLGSLYNRIGCPGRDVQDHCKVCGSRETKIACLSRLLAVVAVISMSSLTNIEPRARSNGTRWHK